MRLDSGLILVLISLTLLGLLGWAMHVVSAEYRYLGDNQAMHVVDYYQNQGDDVAIAETVVVSQQAVNASQLLIK